MSHDEKNCRWFCWWRCLAMNVMNAYAKQHDFDYELETSIPVVLLPTFDTIEEAIAWLVDKTDDPCIDNTRFAFDDDVEARGAYNEAKDNGCCGFADERVLVAGRLGTVGLNYGH